MRIAVTYDNGEIFRHFGRTAQFKLYDIEEGRIINEQIVDTEGTGHGALAGFLRAVKADALICGGIGMGAKMTLSDAGIRLYAGIQGSADEAARAFADGTLEFDPDAECNHHDHDGEGHECDHQHCEGQDCGHHQAE